MTSHSSHRDLTPDRTGPVTGKSGGCPAAAGVDLNEAAQSGERRAGSTANFTFRAPTLDDVLAADARERALAGQIAGLVLQSPDALAVVRRKSGDRNPFPADIGQMMQGPLAGDPDDPRPPIAFVHPDHMPLASELVDAAPDWTDYTVEKLEADLRALESASRERERLAIAADREAPEPKITTPTDWPPLRRIGEPPARSGFPVDALSGPFRDQVESVAEAVQVPLDLPGVIALGAASIATAKLFKVEIGRGHREPTNLFLVSLLPPGERKSATVATMLRPVWDYGHEIRAQAEPHIAAARERYEAERSRIAQLRTKYAKGDEIKRAKFMSEIETISANLREPPAMPMLTAGADSTPEALAMLASENGGRIAQTDAEAGALIRMFNAYQANGSPPAIEFLLKAHAGDYYHGARAGKPGVSIREPALTLVLCGQPEIFRDMKDKKLLRGRGLLARFLVSMPESMVGQRTTAEAMPDPAIAHEYDRALRRMLAIPSPATDEDPDRTYIFTLDPEARAVWEAFAERIERAQTKDGELYDVRDFASKLAGAAGRLAGILAVMDGATGSETIAAPVMINAVRLADYFLDHWRAVHTLAAAERDDEAARRIVAWMRRHPEAETVSEAQLWRDLRSSSVLDSPDDLRGPVDDLVDRGYLRPVQTERRHARGRPASPVYEVHPEARS